MARLHAALAAAAFDATQTQRDITARLGAKYGAIFGAHAGLFEDPSFLADLEHQIRADRFAAEYAVSRTVRDLVQAFEKEGENTFLAWRSADLYDIEKRILKHLLGDRRDPLKDITRPVRRPGPRPDPERDGRPGPEQGVRLRHRARAARPATRPSWPTPWSCRPWSAWATSSTEVASGDTVIVDGGEGVVILDPDPATEAHYRQGPRRPAEPVRRTGWSSATCRASRPTGCRSPCSGTSSSRTRRRPAPPAGPAGSACTGPSSSTSAGTPTRPRRSTCGPTCGSSARWARAGRSSSAPSTWGPTSSSPPTARRSRRRTRPSGVRSVRLCLRDTRCSASSSGPSCGPARSATCGSCSR